MHRRSFIKTTGAAGFIAWIRPEEWLEASASTDLQKRFRNPYTSDRPQVMWFWMNGNISREGITLDLEAMKRAGIGGVFNFDTGISIPEGPVAFGSREWMELKAHALQEAGRLGLSFCMHNCPGWSASGGPWITPEMSMKQLTWSELNTGGGVLHKKLPLPFHKHQYYRDVAVLAYPSLPGEIHAQDFTLSSAHGQVQHESATGENGSGVVVFPEPGEKPGWLLFEFAQPHTLRFISFLVTTRGLPPITGDGNRTNIVLEAADNDTDFYSVATISTGLETELAEGDKFITYDISPVTAKYFRITTAKPRRFSQFRFSGIRRLPKFLEKTGNRFMFSGDDSSPLHVTASAARINDAIDAQSVIDLSSLLDENGWLKWSAPPGNWTLLRFGYTTTGAVNKAAPDAGTGLECDKFSSAAITFHFGQMLHFMKPFLKKFSGKAALALEIDSYEAGPQTWTKDFEKAFLQLRGYDVRRHLVATTGRVLDSEAYTEQFLWDYRRTQADLMAENYYGTFTELCHRNGFTSWVEPYDKGPFEEMQAGARVDVAMGEMWFGLASLLQGNKAVRRTARLAASIMNNKGNNITGAEAFTSEPGSSRWQEYPFSLKALGDLVFCEGANSLVIHRFVHQPHLTARPGMTMGPWGIHFDRTNTWFEETAGWMQYMARCQALLRQGWPVKDLVYFTGEEANVYTRVERSQLHPAPPVGYDYGLMHAEPLLKQVRIRNREIVLPHGMRYRVMVLQDFKGITLPVLQKLHDLVAAGMVLMGKKPEYLLGLSDTKKQDAFEAITKLLWNGMGEASGTTHFGKGLVVWGTSMEPFLTGRNIPPDFEATAASGDDTLLYVHRTTRDAEIYFVCNQRRTTELITASFRVQNRQPEIWDPATGNIEDAVVYENAAGRVRMPLQLDPYGSCFVIFRKPGGKKGIAAIRRNGEIIMETKPFPATAAPVDPRIQHNFTILLRVKPEMDIMTGPSIHMGNVPYPYTDHYALYPSPGHMLYGAGHAACGVAIGRNGVAVWEHAAYPVMVMFAKAAIAGWSHVTIVYESGSPSVYLDGVLIGRGSRSNHTVHPPQAPLRIPDGVSFYNGDLAGVQVLDEIVQQAAILSRAAQNVVPQQNRYLPEPYGSGKGRAMLFWQNGNYTMEEALGETISVTVGGIQPPVACTDPWQLRFPSGQGAPAHHIIPELISLHRVQEEGIRYFSGTVRYANRFYLKDGLVAHQRVFIDLGRVEVMARVTINGLDTGQLWKRPYRTDITDAVHKGWNELIVQVTNLWPNRLIGDEQLPDSDRFSKAGSSGFEHLAGAGFAGQVGQPIAALPEWYRMGKPKPPDGRIGFTTWKHFRKNDPLLESGLIGPVQILFAKVVQL